MKARETETITVFDQHFRIDLSEWERFRLTGDSNYHYKSRLTHGLFMQFTEVSADKFALDYLSWARQQGLQNGSDIIELSEIAQEGVFHYYLISNPNKQYPVLSLVCTLDVKTNAFPVITFIIMNSNSEEAIGEAFIRFAEMQE